MRLDILLVERGLARSRSHARDLIRRGCVRIDGTMVRKAGHGLSAETPIEVAQEPHVSRGALKLIAALDAFGFPVDGRAALDVGASTGGFTQCLLARGARRIYAVDVGSGQLHERLRADARVTDLERTDVRSLTAEQIPEPIGAIVADVSFISLTLALPPALALAASGAWLIALVKPQFELGPKALSSGGVVRDEAMRRDAVAKVEHFVGSSPGWTVAGVLASPLPGREGNLEFLIGATHAA